MTNSAILKPPLPAMIVLGALALGGCSGTNVGSSWQCPLARAEPATASPPPIRRFRRPRRPPMPRRRTG